MNIDKLILKSIKNGKRPRITNTTLKEKSKVGGLMLPYFKMYYEYKAMVNKIVWYW